MSRPKPRQGAGREVASTRWARGSRGSAAVTFVTGTGTGVGKTILTAMLVDHLRSCGVDALAIKPFCTGGRADVEVLYRIQSGTFPRTQINSFLFSEPLAPLAAARRGGRRILLHQAVEKIRQVRRCCSELIVEGCGGLLTPLGEGFTAADLIDALGARVIVLAQNRLGVLNQVLLTVAHLRRLGAHCAAVVCMTPAEAELCQRGNLRILAEWIRPIPVVRLPYLGPRATRPSALKQNSKKLKKTLARLIASGSVRTCSVRSAVGPQDRA